MTSYANEVDLWAAGTPKGKREFCFNMGAGVSVSFKRNEEPQRERDL